MASKLHNMWVNETDDLFYVRLPVWMEPFSRITFDTQKLGFKKGDKVTILAAQKWDPLSVKFCKSIQKQEVVENETPAATPGVPKKL